MESKQLDPVEFYKNLEKYWNKRIHSSTNCPTFTRAFGKSFENHLDQVEIQQKVINNWLTQFNLSKKDDFAELANRKVDGEDKLDDLEEKLYTVNVVLKNNYSELKKLNKSLSEMLCGMENEVKDLKVHKIKSLKNELEELKRLFED
ncbi:hypothetical protein P9D43_22500 [Neobacillus niacini]|uniref:hypothetical protein n=1 Tax=Neobacillus niacini TaxID=86668 RepID=UPI0007AB3C49|nr:hypothetical protein [Neobacillus niacini]MEC1524780.1 hypothetical protein [Neobacillus niacini]